MALTSQSQSDAKFVTEEEKKKKKEKEWLQFKTGMTNEGEISSCPYLSIKFMVNTPWTTHSEYKEKNCLSCLNRKILLSPLVANILCPHHTFSIFHTRNSGHYAPFFPAPVEG